MRLQTSSPTYSTTGATRDRRSPPRRSLKCVPRRSGPKARRTDTTEAHVRRTQLTIFLLAALYACAAQARPADAVAAMPLIKGGQFGSVLPPAPGVKLVSMRSYRLDRT